MLFHVLFLIWACAAGILLAGTLRALFYLRDPRDSAPPVDQSAPATPITILKPLKGVDPGLEENLLSFFKLDYPAFEIIFSVAESSDPVIPLVKKLMEIHSGVPARLIVGAVNVGLNPKVNNLIRAYNAAQYDWILISDSNTRFTPGHLRRLILQCQDGVALQSSVVAGVNPRGLGGRLEAAFLNTFYARSILFLDLLGHPCVMGKAMLFRKSVMDKTRGLRALNKHVAEDYAAGRKFHLLGFKVQVSRNPVQQHIGDHSVKSFWARHLRWGRIRKLQAPAGFIIEPFFSSVLSGIAGAAAFSALWNFSPALFLILHMGLWFLCDGFTARRVGGPVGGLFFPVWILREFIHIPLWVHISLGNTIVWRGQTIRLRKAKILETRAEALEAAARVHT